MEWNDVDVLAVHGIVKPTAASRRHVARRIAKSNKRNPPFFKAADSTLQLIQTQITNARFSAAPDQGNITLKQRRGIVDGYRELLSGLNQTHFLTFMPGRLVKPETIASNMTKFCCRIERVALGKKWFKRTEDRMRLIGFLEKPDITPHYHALAFVPKVTWDVLESCGPDIWEKLMPAGKFEARLTEHPAQAISYVTKDLHHFYAPENVFIYSPITKNR